MNKTIILILAAVLLYFAFNASAGTESKAKEEPEPEVNPEKATAGRTGPGAPGPSQPYRNDPKATVTGRGAKPKPGQTYVQVRQR